MVWWVLVGVCVVDLTFDDWYDNFLVVYFGLLIWVFSGFVGLGCVFGFAVLVGFGF